MCRSSHGLTQAEINLYTISLDLHTLGGVRQINKDIKTTALKSLRVQTDFCRFCLASVPLRRSTGERSEAAGPNCWVVSPRRGASTWLVELPHPHRGDGGSRSFCRRSSGEAASCHGGWLIAALFDRGDGRSVCQRLHVELGGWWWDKNALGTEEPSTATECIVILICYFLQEGVEAGGVCNLTRWGRRAEGSGN